MNAESAQYYIHTFDYSLWKATKISYWQTNFASALKTPGGEWAKSEDKRANTFANHLSDVFKPYPRQVTTKEQDIAIRNPLVSPYVAIPPIKKTEAFSAFQSLKYKKASGYDFITQKILNL